MTPADFIAKWRHVSLTERASSQTHFIDLCRLVAHPDPIAADPQGTSFTFERGATKATGAEGWADVWKKGFFGWEYKGKHKDLNAAYVQLLMYQGALENPPLLVTCDTDRIVIHTHFPNTPTTAIELTLEGLLEPEQLATLRAVFHAPSRLQPNKTIQAITEEAAEKVTTIAQALRGRGISPERVARFLDRVVFCLFAEDVGLLPNKVFTRVVENTQGEPERFRVLVADLFAQMATGGHFGADHIEHFNGNLFEATEALDITSDELRDLRAVSELDWSNIDASIFGTLFERALDPDKRSQLGAHYTSREDIEMIVDPVVMEPLQREWEVVRKRFDTLVGSKQDARKWKAARTLIRSFLDRLGSVEVLDPACGSGNFLFVTLQRLKDLEKEVIVHTSAYFSFFPQVGPWQLRGIEINSYAHDLAQMTVWIGHLQWHERHGMRLQERPILRPMTNFQLRDAVIDHTPAGVREPEWPDAEFIVSNPPFLGDKFMRSRLGDEYVDALRGLYDHRVPAAADLCCYWFEKARAQVEAGKCIRAGLLATQAIRGGANRAVLNRILSTGGIFFAISDREWMLDGAAVRVSMVGFDNGADQTKVLDGRNVPSINSNLRTGADTTQAVALSSNRDRAFIGVSMHGPFEIETEVAMEMLTASGNVNGRPNSDAIRLLRNAESLVQRPRDRFAIFFDPTIAVAAASHYERPFHYVQSVVKPVRDRNRRAAYRNKWWIHGEARPAMLGALKPLQRYLVTPRVSKHRIFAWQRSFELPSDALVALAIDDDYGFGVLHSSVHERWARATGTQLREVESGFRYTPTSCFDTFPFPDVTPDQREAIARAAQQLDRLRARWLNPAEWLRDEVTEFQASIDGPWSPIVTGVNSNGIGTARYVRAVPRDDDAGELIRARTLTALYNEPPTWLTDCHRALDLAVLNAYGLDPAASAEDVLEHLLELNDMRSV